MIVNKIDSSCIKGIGYSFGKLTVVFNNGKVYKYKCDKEIYDTFLMTESKGRYYTSVIKGSYPVKKVRPLFVITIGGKNG